MGSRTSSEAETHPYHPPFPSSLEGFAFVTFASICTIIPMGLGNPRASQCPGLHECPAAAPGTWRCRRDGKVPLADGQSRAPTARAFCCRVPLALGALGSAPNHSGPHRAGISRHFVLESKTISPCLGSLKLLSTSDEPPKSCVTDRSLAWQWGRPRQAGEKAAQRITVMVLWKSLHRA